jgi:hypothetical protein
MLFAVPSTIGALFCVVFMYVLIRKPSWQLLFISCLYAISVYQLAGAFITSLISRGAGGYGIQRFWDMSLAISRLRYIPLVLFVHSAHRFRVTPVLTGLMIVIVGAGMVSSLFFYSVLPNLVEITVVLYAFLYWLIVYLMRHRLSIPPGRQGLLRAVLA